MTIDKTSDQLRNNGFYIIKICKDLSGKHIVLIGTKTYKRIISETIIDELDLNLVQIDI